MEAMVILQSTRMKILLTSRQENRLKQGFIVLNGVTQEKGPISITQA
jgi:hypothetical protein